MFVSLLVATFLISLAVSFIVSTIFKPAVKQILERVISDPIYSAWVRYIIFAIYVVGISAGVRIWDLEKYVSPTARPELSNAPLILNSDRWILEVYRTIIGTLQGLAWLLLVFFAVALIAYVIVKIGEAMAKVSGRRSGQTRSEPADGPDQQGS